MNLIVIFGILAGVLIPTGVKVRFVIYGYRFIRVFLLYKRLTRLSAIDFRLAIH